MSAALNPDTKRNFISVKMSLLSSSSTFISTEREGHEVSSSPNTPFLNAFLLSWVGIRRDVGGEGGVGGREEVVSSYLLQTCQSFI